MSLVFITKSWFAGLLGYDLFSDEHLIDYNTRVSSQKKELSQKKWGAAWTPRGHIIFVSADFHVLGSGGNVEVKFQNVMNVAGFHYKILV